MIPLEIDQKDEIALGKANDGCECLLVKCKVYNGLLLPDAAEKSLVNVLIHGQLGHDHEAVSRVGSGTSILAF